MRRVYVVCNPFLAGLDVRASPYTLRTTSAGESVGCVHYDASHVDPAFSKLVIHRHRRLAAFVAVVASSSSSSPRRRPAPSSREIRQPCPTKERDDLRPAGRQKAHAMRRWHTHVYRIYTDRYTVVMTRLADS